MRDLVVRRFFALFRDLSCKETCHEAVLPMIEQHGDAFYLIGSLPGDTEAMMHEAAHSLYYLDPEYRRDMDSITRGWKHAAQFKDALVKKGYDPVALDETQAYMATAMGKWFSAAKVFRRWKGRLA